MKFILAFLLFSAAVMAASAFEIALGKCPNPPKLAGFDPSKFTGEWHEIKRTRVPFEPGVTCAVADVTLDGSDLAWKLKGKGLFGVPFEVPFVGEETEQTNVYEINLLNTGYKSSMTIVDTDYETYAVAYACNDLAGYLNAKDAWIFGRKSELSDEVVASALKKLSPFGIAADKLEEVNENC